MNPIVQFLLAQLFNILEGLIQSEGPAVLTWLEQALQNLISSNNPAVTNPVSHNLTATAGALNPILQDFLQFLFGQLESLVASGGPAVLAWIQAELAALQQKYAPPAPPANVPVNPHG
jgi:hypothetical protein